MRLDRALHRGLPETITATTRPPRLLSNFLLCFGGTRDPERSDAKSPYSAIAPL
jgi:hypothetical protein